LLKHVQEFGKYIAIAGFRTQQIENVEAFLEKAKNAAAENCEIQFFDAGLVASWQHLYFAALNALKAFKNGENISKSLAMEMLLYASAQRQIHKAMNKLGIKQNICKVAVVVVGENPNNVESTLNNVLRVVDGKRDDKVLGLTPEKIAKVRRVFEISDTEIEAVADGKTLEEAITDLVIERMALLATER